MIQAPFTHIITQSSLSLLTLAKNKVWQRYSSRDAYLHYTTDQKHRGARHLCVNNPELLFTVPPFFLSRKAIHTLLAYSHTSLTRITTHLLYSTRIITRVYSILYNANECNLSFQQSANVSNQPHANLHTSNHIIKPSHESRGHAGVTSGISTIDTYRITRHT